MSYEYLTRKKPLGPNSNQLFYLSGLRYTHTHTYILGIGYMCIRTHIFNNRTRLFGPSRFDEDSFIFDFGIHFSDTRIFFFSFAWAFKATSWPFDAIICVRLTHTTLTHTTCMRPPRSLERHRWPQPSRSFTSSYEQSSDFKMFCTFLHNCFSTFVMRNPVSSRWS